MSTAWGQISHDFARILENNSIFGRNLQKIKNTRTNKNTPMNGRFFKFSEFLLKIKSEKNFCKVSHDVLQ